ncbi:hypothetical protein KKH13_01845 [Patescibacteria group bacterium]|nr:hypothetical protein [Patescibacteria group bacterium]
MNPFIVQLKKRLKQKGLKGLGLDIDDTLAESGDAWIKGIQKQFGNPENLTIDEVKRKYRYSYNAPYWQGKTIRAWEKSIRHNNQWHRVLPLIKNANHVVEKIHQLVPIVVYLTARPKSILPGTRDWLKQHGFPEAEIVYRPQEVKLPLSLAWKAQVLEYLYPQVIGMVDDHPQLAKDLSKKYPGTLYLYDYHDQAPRGDINIVPCKNWDEVLVKVRALK